MIQAFGQFVVGGNYVVGIIVCVAAVLTLYVAVGLKLFAESTFGQIPYAGVIFSTGIALYFLMVDMRVLGLIFHANRERLGW